MTINVVFISLGPEETSCKDAAEAWHAFRETLLTQPATLTLSSLPLKELKSIEVNLQSVRWPSTIRPDMGGYAEYMLRVFTSSDEGMAVSTLENTPDVARLLLEPKMKDKLLAWIKEPKNLSAIDNGAAQIPNEFLAVRATSVALQGNHRLTNAPFTRLFRAADFADLDFSQTKTIRSPMGALKRLNDLSCVGCHQGRTVAGFHFLGKDRNETDDVNSIAVSASPHFLRDQLRRSSYQASVLAGEKPVDSRPLSVRSDHDEGDFGSHCGLGDPSFALWTCRPGLECRAIVQDAQVSPTGICVPSEPSAGAACQVGRMLPDSDSHRDRVLLGSNLSCGSQLHCEDTRVGFPGGMCSGGCQNLAKDEICGSIAILQGFNNCLAKSRPFNQCLRENVRPASLRACSETQPCRDDYICTRTASGGACIPPYFLFQLRVDGHPKPRA